MTRVLLGLGSNLGDKEKNIKDAITSISAFSIIKKKSHLYHTEPVGFADQPWFLNCAIEIETEVKPHELLSLVKSIEQKLGRKKTITHGPRQIDIDILFYGDFVLKTKDLVIPHPLIQDRLFVLQPLLDIDPFFIHPVQKKSIQELYKHLSATHEVHLYK
jgi:2-amino-4-hydroxy-6-hydroxymethyldihydropteridine diphosphokinase